jgi:TRAP-type transport system periplasmic protein
MKKGNITVWGVVLMIGLVIGFLTMNAGSVSAQDAGSGKKVELKAISFMPANVTKSKLFKEYLNRVEKASNGELSMKFLGGPEVIGLPEQGQGVGRGTVDMALLPPSVIQGMVPEANVTILSRGLTQEEEIQRGIIGKLQPFYNKANLYCLGEIFGLNAPQFMLYTKKKIEKLSDMKGLAVGMNGPMFKPAADALGLVMKVVPFSEAYTALERKVVEGWFSSNSAITSFAGQEQVKFCVDHSVFVDPAVVIINLAKWNSLSKTAQDALHKTMMANCAEFGRLNTEDETKAIDVCKKAGVEYVKLQPNEAKTYVDTIYNSMWSDWEKKMPGSVPELRKLLTK